MPYLVVLKEGADRVLLHRRQRFPRLQKFTGHPCCTQREASQQQPASAQFLPLLRSKFSHCSGKQLCSWEGSGSGPSLFHSFCNISVGRTSLISSTLSVPNTAAAPCVLTAFVLPMKHIVLADVNSVEIEEPSHTTRLQALL